MKNAFWPNIFRGWNKQESETVLTLKQVPIFEGFSNREFKELEKLIHHRTYKPGEYVFKVQAPGEGMYILFSGHIEIVLGGESESKHVLATLKKGDFFGELALFDEEPRSAAALSTDHSEMLGFFRPDLFSLLDRNPVLGNKILLNLARVIGERLRVTNKLLLQAQATKED